MLVCMLLLLSMKLPIHNLKSNASLTGMEELIKFTSATIFTLCTLLFRGLGGDESVREGGGEEEIGQRGGVG